MRFQLAKFRVTGPRLCFRRPWNLCHDLRLPSATIGPTPSGASRNALALRPGLDMPQRQIDTKDAY
jgi:hypothetical protein